MEQLVKSAPVAEFVNEVEVVGCFEHVDILDDVGARLEGREDVDLVDCAFLELGDLAKLLGLHHLDGHFLLGDHVHRLVYLRIHTLAQLLLQLVVLYDLTH